MKKILLVTSLLVIIAGFVLVGSGIWGLAFTYKSVVRENITTPKDASIPSVPVRGPFTLKAQADIIRDHTLHITEGKTFAEMPRQIPKVDLVGEQILDEGGNPVMTANTARDIWFSATTLITALNLGLFAYVFSAVIILLGLFFIWVGLILFILVRERLIHSEGPGDK